MRIVSLVPSWTETLLEADVNVVGRTRFCIHPKEKVNGIARVGGTKDWQWERILGLKPDLLILDKEENPKFMSEQNEIPYLATHVASVQDMPREMEKLAQKLENKKLEEIRERWREVLTKNPLSKWNFADDLPGLLHWGKKPEKKPAQVLYVIWKDPWMIAEPNTFIGSVLSLCGLSNLQKSVGKKSKYPEIDLREFSNTDTLLLFSSEPYPFLKYESELGALGFPFAFVNGESFSWFGVRTLRFLESIL